MLTLMGQGILGKKKDESRHTVGRGAEVEEVQGKFGGGEESRTVELRRPMEERQGALSRDLMWRPAGQGLAFVFL